MSIITVQVGQCGNQLGRCFFSQLASEFSQRGNSYGDQAWLPFFRANETLSMREPNESVPIARSVLIDMEPKAVHCAISEAREGGWRYPHNRVFVAQSGSGNNWAAGYKLHGPQVVEQCLELVRQEAECVDHWGGTLMIQSVAGGTGSGLGAFLAGAMADEFSSTPLLNCCIWPYSSGEVIVQNYNSLLTLSSLFESSRGTIIVENDMLHAVCNKVHGMKRVELSDMNNVAAKALALALLPSKCKATINGSLTHTRLLVDLVQHLCSHPNFPLLSLWSEPQMPRSSIEFTAFHWDGIMKRVQQVLASGYHAQCPGSCLGLKSPSSGVLRSVASLVVLRGLDSKNVNPVGLYRKALYPKWNPNPLMVATSEGRVGDYDKSAAVLSNSQAAIAPCLNVKDQAWKMLRSKAYLHQYARYGLQTNDFQIAFSYIEDTIARYLAL